VESETGADLWYTSPMAIAKPRSSRDWRVGRRLRAWGLQQQGWTGTASTETLGVTKGAVTRWLKRAREGGADALYTQAPPGPASRLTAPQLPQLPSLLARGAEAFGFIGEVWTAKRVAAVIRDEFGGRYHPDHVGRLLRTAGRSPRKPIRRAIQYNGAAIERWITERWPALEAKPNASGAPASGSDGSAFYPLPAVVRTWAPRGETPVLHARLTRDHLSDISGITPAGQILLQVRDCSLRGPNVVRFLQHLLCRVSGKLLVIWEGAPIYRGRKSSRTFWPRAARRASTWSSCLPTRRS
jgi:transposase